MDSLSLRLISYAFMGGLQDYPSLEAPPMSLPLAQGIATLYIAIA